jgi:hypothetical protein
MSKPNPESPNKRNVEKLLKELSGRGQTERCPSYGDYKAADEACAAAYLAWERSAAVSRLKRRKDRLWAKVEAEKSAIGDIVTKLRQLYYATGLTPIVLKTLAELVNDLR